MTVMRAPFAAMLLLALAGCGEKVFYYPNRVLYADPDRLGIKAELVRYPSQNGQTLTALFFPAEKPRGTIVHFHGNFGNVSNHFPASYFLVKRGFNLLVFDYQGYGGSAGKPTRAHTVEDGQASLNWALARSTLPVAVLGQSLGGAAAAVAVSKEPRVKALALEATFTTYRAAANDVLKGTPWTWPLLYWYPAIFIRGGLDPIEHVGQISPRPIFFVHGTGDRTIPSWMSERLYAAAQEPKTLWLVPGGEHIGLKRAAGKEYEDRLTAFFDAAFAAK